MKHEISDLKQLFSRNYYSCIGSATYDLTGQGKLQLIL